MIVTRDPVERLNLIHDGTIYQAVSWVAIVDKLDIGLFDQRDSLTVLALESLLGMNLF